MGVFDHVFVISGFVFASNKFYVFDLNISVVN